MAKTFWGDMVAREHGAAYFLVASPIDARYLSSLQTRDKLVLLPWVKKEPDPLNQIIEKVFIENRSTTEIKLEKNIFDVFDRYYSSERDLSSVYRSLTTFYADPFSDIESTRARQKALPIGQTMAVISEENGVFRVERGYIPGKSPAATMGTKKELPTSRGPHSLQSIVEEASNFENQVGAPVVIQPNQLTPMQGNVVFPPNAYMSVSLFALDKPLEQRIS
ncbi:MAG: hypothetical protein AABX51_01930 [Nanoarchaeota archaeon]